MPMRSITLFSIICALLAAVAVTAQERPSRARGNREDGALKVGQMAPTFSLNSPDGKQAFTLKDFRGKRPVILFFGSYT